MWVMTTKNELLNLDHIKMLEMKDLSTSKDDKEKWGIIAHDQDRYYILQTFEDEERCKNTFEQKAFYLCNGDTLTTKPAIQGEHKWLDQI